MAGTHAAPVCVCVCACARVCACLYGKISRSNLGRARVNSGTNGRARESKRDGDEYRSERSGGRKGSVGRRREENHQEVQSSHSSCSLAPRPALEETLVLITPQNIQVTSCFHE